MLLDSMTIQNFRQFYGEQNIFFAKPDGAKNITIIHGENGSGKTALLNAFSWCFYGETTFQNSQLLLNEKKLLELEVDNTADVSVIIRFKDRGKKYTVTRIQTYQKTKDSPLIINEYFNLEYIDESGKSIKTTNPQRIIEQIMPRTMSSYFFFDGERIDNLSKNERAKDVQLAIKTIMGLEMMDRAKKHLEQVQKRFRSKLQSFSGPETQLIIENLNNIEEKIKERQDEIVQIEKNQSSLNNHIFQIDQRLKQLEGAKELQEKREFLESSRKEINEKIDEIKRQLVNIISDHGYLAYSDAAIRKTKEILEQKRQKGEIPSGIKEQFVQDLLARGQCICGETLTPGSRHYHEVEQWLERAGSKELEDTFINTFAKISTLEQKREQLFIDIKRLVNDQMILSQRLREIIQQIEEIGDEFERGSEEIGDLERKRKELSTEYDTLHQKIGSLHEQIRQMNAEKQQIEAELKKAQTLDEKARIAKKRMDACGLAIEVIDQILLLQSEYVRGRLQERIGEVYSKLLRKGYTVELDESYSINVYKPFGEGRRAVDMSTGERQVTSLSFLGALVDIAREQAEKSKASDLFQGGIIPIVMDSPFGSLDPDHQSRIAEGIPSLAHQIVVMVSSSQYAGIESKITPFVGKEYKLNYFDPRLNESITHEFTAIEEVK
jgi:DNA sulfur modification protein DndD